MPQSLFDGKHCQLATRIPKALHRAVKLAALEEGTPVQEWVSDALGVYLAGKAGTAADEDTRKSRAAAAPRRARASV